MKKTYPSIPGLEPDAWSNDACRGYVIMAMQDCGFSHEDIRRVVRQLYEVLLLHGKPHKSHKRDALRRGSR